MDGEQHGCPSVPTHDRRPSGGGRADQLNAYNVHRGTPDYVNEDLQRYLDADAGDLAEAARLLDPEGATTLSVVPAGQTDRALPGSRPALAR